MVYWEIDSEETSLLAPVVVLATGRHDEPVGHHLPGAGEYRGHLLHSADYRNPGDFEDRSVLGFPEFIRDVVRGPR